MSWKVIWSNYELPEYEDCAGFLEIARENDEFFEDEKANLSHAVLSGQLVLLARLGLWNGTVDAYRVEDKATTVADCLKFERDCEYAEWYVEGNDLCSRQSHHDGTHHIIYRVWKPGITEKQKENFLEKVYNQKATRRDVTRYTQGLGRAVSEIYGW